MRRRLCHIPDTGDFLKQVSTRSLWICTAPASSEPLLSCLAKKGQCLCWLFCARQVGLEPRCPRFQHLYQRFTAMLWDSLIVLCLFCPPCCHFPLLGRRVSGILGVSFNLTLNYCYMCNTWKCYDNTVLFSKHYVFILHEDPQSIQPCIKHLIHNSFNIKITCTLELQRSFSLSWCCFKSMM